jgi:hypothetical protein
MKLKELVNFIKNDKIISILIIFGVILVGTLLYYNLNVKIAANQNQLIENFENAAASCDDWYEFKRIYEEDTTAWYKLNIDVGDQGYQRYIRKEPALNFYKENMTNHLSEILYTLVNPEGEDGQNTYVKIDTEMKIAKERIPEDIKTIIKDEFTGRLTGNDGLAAFIKDDVDNNTKYTPIINMILENINDAHDKGLVDSSLDTNVIGDILTYIFFFIFAIETEVELYKCKQELKSNNYNQIHNIHKYVSIMEIKKMIDELLNDLGLIEQLFMNQANLKIGNGPNMFTTEQAPPAFWFNTELNNTPIDDLLNPVQDTFVSNAETHISTILSNIIPLDDDSHYKHISDSIPDVNKIEMGPWESNVNDSVVYSAYMSPDAAGTGDIKDYITNIDDYCVQQQTLSAYTSQLDSISCPPGDATGYRLNWNTKRYERYNGKWEPFNTYNVHPDTLSDDKKMRFYKGGKRKNIFEDSRVKPVGAKFCRGGWSTATSEYWYKAKCEAAGGKMLDVDPWRGPYMCAIGGDYPETIDGKCGPNNGYKKCKAGEYCSGTGICITTQPAKMNSEFNGNMQPSSTTTTTTTTSVTGNMDNMNNMDNNN